jgi:GNAT superfamily N-acetyltransferase
VKPLETKVITYLQMTSPDQLNCARLVHGVTVTPVEQPAGCDFAKLRAVHDRIAVAHHWSSLTWSRQQWIDWLDDTTLHHWWIKLHGEAIGWGCLRRHPGPEVELDTFGIVPEHLGHGYGGHALSILTNIAWRLHGLGTAPGISPAVRRVWLHTSSWDHPHALTNYRKRGFLSASTPDTTSA